jgi:hexosaminidase
MIRTSFLLFCLCCLFACTSTPTKQNNYDLIPYPNSLKAQSGQFVLDNHTKLILPDVANDTIFAIANELVEQIQKASGILLTEDTFETEQSIIFIINKEKPEEAYSLNIDEKRVLIEASAPSGFFYAIQTLRQLFPEAVYGNEVAQNTEWTLPCVNIEDAPRFKYRGMHLDVSRHFFDVKEVKRYIDLLALHKLNRFHWHLTDDQGWRIEIKNYPELTDIGSIRKKTMILKEWENYDHTPYGGFYTQKEIREIVEYASHRFITVIPEIDLPGHMMAALASYPELGCTGGPYDVSGQWGVREDVLCVGKESTFTFLENVFTEILDLFPSEYIHIGGDECPKDRWEKCPHCQAKIKKLGLKPDDKYQAEHYLQSYTISRIEQFLNANGRRIIGWDEILEGGLAPNATVMSWRGIDGGKEAALQNHSAIMTPNSHLYFDQYQSQDAGNEPFAIGGYLPVEKVYSFEPVPDEFPEENRKYIIGVQANLWTEYITTNEQLEYMLLPRLAALSEVQWTQAGQKNWDRFLASSKHLAEIYDLLGYNYAKHIYNDEKPTGSINAE